MKRNLLILVIFVAVLVAMIGLGWPALGQVVNSSQVKIQTNGGLAGDTASALVVSIYRGTSAPAGPLSSGMMWCDTTLTPCILKQYTGSAWVIPLTPASVPTQTDTSSFPGSPTDGQIFFSAAPPSLWIYSSTLGKWATFATPMITSAANIRDLYTAAVISTVGAATAALSATAGSLANGTYSYKITCRTAIGGETTGGTVSNTVTISGGPISADLTSIPICGAGTTNRNIYRSKTGAGTTGPWYWVKNLADNSTTTANDGVADASLLLLAPDINFSAALPGAWTATLSGATPTTGGCGGTGSTRGTMACYGGVSGVVALAAITTDPYHRATLDISAYSTGAYTIQYRIKQMSANGDTYPSVTAFGYGGLRYGTADNAVRVLFSAGSNANSGGCGATTPTFPLSASVHFENCWGYRTAAAGASTVVGTGNAWPQIDAFPVYFRWVRRGGAVNGFISSDGVVWTTTTSCVGPTVTTAACSFQSASMGSSALDHFEIPMAAPAAVQTNKGWIEIDQFTLTIN